MSNPVFMSDKTRFKVLEKIVEHSFTRDAVFGISLDEISDSLGLSGRPAVHYHVKILLKEGWITKTNRSRKNLKPTNRGKALVSILNEEKDSK